MCEFETYGNTLLGSPWEDNQYLFESEDEIMNEQEQRQQALTITEQAQSFVIATQQDYSNAAEVCKDIKARIKDIEEYWKPLKEAAAKQHKDICAKEKELLNPFTSAEQDIKGKMTAWQRQKLEEERILREEQERFRREEAERLLAEAVKAEKEGMAENADYLVEMAEQAKNIVFEQPKQVKTAGTAVKTVWKAKIINEKIVPIELNGMLLRPIDTALINKLAVNSKGSIKIPGVEFYEDVQIAVSRG
jgi:hypothetical protein